MKFAVLDLETTGGMAHRDRIIEIGIVHIEDGKIENTYSSLVNPERSIPYHITRITGIDDQMVANAPRFYEIAKEVVQQTEGRILVAHNLQFDYSFLKHEFRRLGYFFQRKRICSLKLSRRQYPKLRSHGLSNLIREFQLTIDGRHRALGDAKATAELMIQILDEQSGTAEIQNLLNFGVQTSRLPDQLDLRELHDLPERSGIYYFYNQPGDLLYVGKSGNIQKRVFQHFRNLSQKGQKIHREVSSIRWESTPGELVAVLVEDQLIKQLQPPINKAQKNKQFPFVICQELAGDRIAFTIRKATQNQKKDLNIVAEFGSFKAAKGRLEQIAGEMDLCYCSLIENAAPSGCWKKQIGQCNMQGVAPPDSISDVTDRLQQYFDSDQWIIQEDPFDNSLGIIQIEGGICTGYGKWEGPLEKSDLTRGFAELTPVQGSYYTNRLLYREMQRKQNWEVIRR